MTDTAVPSEADRRSALSAQQIELDIAAQIVFREGRPLPRLPHKEFVLLRFLLEHAGSVVTREEIMEHVWGTILSPSEASRLDVHMRRLRNRLEADPHRPVLIRTLRGVGYIFDTEPVPSD